MENLHLELQLDKQNLWYMDFDFTKSSLLNIDKREFDQNRYYQVGFYPIESSKDYIIKYSYTVFTRLQIKKIKYMLTMLIQKQGKVLNTDFPIGYCKSRKRLCGLIIRYYPETLSLREILLSENLELLKNYYLNDENSIHNLFLCFLEILNNLEEMIDNDIYYTDVNYGNIVFYNNLVKIIDFDSNYLTFDLKGKEKDEKIRCIMCNYLRTVSDVLKKFNLYDSVNIETSDVCDTKSYIKTLENRIRRG